ncbi:MAG TPA: type II toxin-antitoxin system Phd/YefM family antitoxin [Verrucomicrobiae bacterium]|nr:type II toxin-antitoxin system Phd/YefM family antitoxin [Verrucomicrobiae bacterium]
MQDAKNKLSEVVDTSISKGPQIISRRGRNTAVVMSYEDYRRHITPKKGLKKLLMSTDLDELDLARDQSVSGRATDLKL